MKNKQRSRHRAEALQRKEMRTDKRHHAYRMAAAILLVGAAIALIGGLLSGGGWIALAIGTTAVDVLLAVGLLQFGRKARTLVLIRAILGAIVWPAFYFASYNLASAVLASTAQLAYAGALILLLTGRAENWRFIVSGSLFSVLTLGINGVAWILAALM